MTFTVIAKTSKNGREIKRVSDLRLADACKVAIAWAAQGFYITREVVL